VVIGHEHGKEGAFILASARPEWQPPDALYSHPGYVQIDLQPLDEGASYLLAAELLQRVELVPESVLELIAERSEGVPYFAEEIVNWFIDQGILDRVSDPWRFISTRFDQSPLPPTLQHLLYTRLNALNKTQRAVLQRGAIFGRSFWEGGLAAMGLSPDEEVLVQLQQRGFVEAQNTSSFEGDREWRFQHNLMRDVTYESVLKRQRPELHKAAGIWLEAQALAADRLDEWSGRIGEHAEHAGETSSAADWYLRAGRRAKTQGALVEARDFFDRTLKLLPADDHERRWQALLDREEVLGVLGETELRRGDTDSLLKLAEEFEGPDRLAEANYRIGIFFESMGNPRAALDAFELALEESRLAEDQILGTTVLAMMVVCQTRLGDLKKASGLARETMLHSEELEDESALARALTNVAVYYTESGDIAKAARLTEQQIEINHRLGDRAGEAIGLGNVGYNYLQLGFFEKGRLALERALELNAALGARRANAYNLLNLGLAQWRVGESRNALHLLEQAHPGLEAHGDAFALGAMHSYSALVLEQIGDLEGASASYREAMEILGQIGLHGFVQDSLAGLARCALTKGHKEEALQYVMELCDYLEHHGAKGMEFPMCAYQTCARVFEDVGDEAKSRAAIEGGYRELMSRAEIISDTEWRKSFLENVPENRALIEMWNRMAGVPA
jgi:tetratricopeptide (TPR) repeat protein